MNKALAIPIISDDEDDYNLCHISLKNELFAKDTKDIAAFGFHL